MPAIGKSKAPGKVYSKKNTVKKAYTGTGTRTGPGTMKKKKYADKFSDTKAKAKKAMTSDKAYSFKEAFAKGRGGGADKFTFKGKSYLTKKPSELKKKSLREKLTGYKTQSGYEEARTKRIKEKRIASMEKRKGEGKSYSAKNLAGLKGSEKKTKTKYITKKTMPSVRKPS